MRSLIAAIGLMLGLISPSAADQVRIAVAANFAAVADELASVFAAETGHDVVISAGASGQLYAQITQGAPFDVLLSADGERPARAVREGYGIDGSVFTYAIGRLVLFSPSIDVSGGPAILSAGDFDHLAIADPETAPYGSAAIGCLAALGVLERLRPRFVTGQSVAQTLQFVDSGNAELGFVALSQVIGRTDGHVWLVPANLHAPIIQDAVLLGPDDDSAAARAFLVFLQSEEGRAIIERHGYGTRDG